MCKQIEKCYDLTFLLREEWSLLLLFGLEFI